jgi:hypothetical protein
MFVVGLATSIKLYMKNEPRYITLATVVLGITLMQLLEYFIFLNHGKTRYNLMLSFVLHVFILLHVITFVSLCIHYDMFGHKEFYEPVLTFLIIFLFFFIAVTITTNWRNAYTLKNSCRLSWGPYKDPNNKLMAWGMGLSYVIIFFMLFYVLMGPKGLAIIIPTCVFSLIFSRTYDRSGTMGSYWCFLVLILCILGGIFDLVP